MASGVLYCSLSVHVQSRLFPRNESKLKKNKVEKSQKSFNKMWSEGGYDNAGGFYEEGQNGSQTPGGGEKKRQRANNIVPVGVQTVLGCGK